MGTRLLSDVEAALVQFAAEEKAVAIRVAEERFARRVDVIVKKYGVSRANFTTQADGGVVLESPELADD